MLYAYIFALVLGGVLLAVSLFTGHGDGGGGHDAGGEHDAGSGHHDGHAAHASSDVVAALLSLRFWTFFLAFFGLTGLALDALGLATTLVAAAVALTMGLAVGGGATLVMRRLGRTPDSAARNDDYVGKTARVLVAITKGGTGKVRLQLKGSTVDLLAVSDEDEPLALQDEVMVVEIDGTRARVAKMKD